MPIGNDPSFGSTSRTTLGSPTLTGPQQQPVAESSRGSKLREVSDRFAMGGDSSVAEGSQRSKLRGTVQPGVPTHARGQHVPTQSIEVSTTRAGKSGGARTVAARATTPAQNGRRAGAAGVEQRLRHKIQEQQEKTVRLLREAATQPKVPELKGWRAILNRLCGGPRPVKPADIAASLVRVNDSLLKYQRYGGGGILRLGEWTAALEALRVSERLAVIDLLHDGEFQTALTSSMRPPRRADGDDTCTPLGEARTLVAAAQAALPSCYADIRADATAAANEAMKQNRPQCLDRMLRAAEAQLAPFEGRLSPEGRRQMALDAVINALMDQGEDGQVNALRSGSLDVLHELHARAQEIGAGDEAIGRAIAERPELIQTETGRHANEIEAALRAWQEQAPNVENPACRAAASRLCGAIQQYAAFAASQGLDADADFAGIKHCNELIGEARKQARMVLEQWRASIWPDVAAAAHASQLMLPGGTAPDLSQFLQAMEAFKSKVKEIRQSPKPDATSSTALGTAAHEVQALLQPFKTSADLLQALATFDREVQQNTALAALADCSMGELRAALIGDLLADYWLDGDPLDPDLATLTSQLSSMDVDDLQHQLEAAASFSLNNDRLEAHALACRLIGHLELLRSYAAGDAQTAGNMQHERRDLRPILMTEERRRDPAPPLLPGRRDPEREEQAQQTRRAIEDLLQLNLPSERPAGSLIQGRYDDDMMAVYTRAVMRPFSSIPSEATKVDLGDGLKPSESFMHDARRKFSIYLPDREPVIDHQGWDALDERQRDERIHAGLRKLVVFYGDVDKVNALTASLGQARFGPLIEPWGSRPVTLPDGRQVIPFLMDHGSDRDPGWGESASDTIRLGKTSDGTPCLVLERTLSGGRAVEARDGVPMGVVNLDPSSWQRITCVLQLGADLDHVEPMPGSERPHYELDLQVSSYQKLDYPPPSWEVLVASVATNKTLRADLGTAAEWSDMQAEAQAFTAIRQFAAHPCGATAAPVLAALADLDEIPGLVPGAAIAEASDRVQQLGNSLSAAFDGVRRELEDRLAECYQNALTGQQNEDLLLRRALRRAMGDPNAELPATYSQFLQNATERAKIVFKEYLSQPTRAPEIVEFLEGLDRLRAVPSADAARQLLSQLPAATGGTPMGIPDPDTPAIVNVSDQTAQDARARVEAALRDDENMRMDPHLFDPVQERLRSAITELAEKMRAGIGAGVIT